MIANLLKTLKLAKSDEFSYFFTCADERTSVSKVLQNPSLVGIINSFNRGLTINSQAIKFQDTIESLSVSDDGKTIVLTSRSPDRKLMVIENADTLSTFKYNEIDIRKQSGLKFSTISENIKTITTYKRPESGETRFFEARISGNGKTIIAITNRSSTIWEINGDGVWNRTKSITDTFYDMGISRDGRIIMFVYNDGEIITFQKLEKEFFTDRRKTNKYTKTVWVKTLSVKIPNAREIASSDNMNVIAVLDKSDQISILQKESERWNRKVNLGVPALDMALALDGTVLVSACDNAIVKIWDTTNGECKHTLIGHAAYKMNRFNDERINLNVNAVSISGDGSTVVSGGDDEKVLIWDVKTGKLKHTIEANGKVRSIDISRDGYLIAYTTDDQRVIITKITNDHI